MSERYLPLLATIAVGGCALNSALPKAVGLREFYFVEQPGLFPDSVVKLLSSV